MRQTPALLVVTAVICSACTTENHPEFHPQTSYAWVENISYTTQSRPTPPPAPASRPAHELTVAEYGAIGIGAGPPAYPGLRLAGDAPAGRTASTAPDAFSACKEGDAMSCERLGDLYANEEDPQALDYYGAAATLYGSSCRRGSRTDCTNFARITEPGFGAHVYRAREPSVAARDVHIHGNGNVIQFFGQVGQVTINHPRP
jgi:hypothetical protein